MGDVPTLCYDVVYEWLVFYDFSIQGFNGESIITICKFDELYGNIKCKVSEGGRGGYVGGL